MTDGQGRPSITVINTTIQERMAAQLKQDREDYEAEMRMLSEGGADYAGDGGWKKLMRQVGRR